MAIKNKSLVSINDYTKDEYLTIMDFAQTFEKNPVQNILQNNVIATLFFEPSTRTRLSFESAITRLGGKFIGFADSRTSSVAKGESLKDTIKTVSNYCDLIVMRHYLEGSARYASEISSVPVINAGDGTNQHPTQTLLDLYSIKKTQNTLDNLHIALIGDLKYGRTVHSLLIALSHFNTTFHFVAPEELKMPDEYKSLLSGLGLPFYEYTEIEAAINKVDIIYMTRIQKERFNEPMEYEKTKNSFILKEKMLVNTKENTRILHPLPRVNEINQEIDDSKKAYYFQQALNGVYIRQALITRILGLI